MANTYTPATANDNDRNRVRLLIRDTNTTAGKYAFEDEEIDALLSINADDLYRAAAAACRALATDKAKTAIVTSLLGDELDLKSVSDRYLRLAQEYERRSDNEPVSIVTQLTDEDLEFVDSLTARDYYDYEGGDS